MKLQPHSAPTARDVGHICSKLEEVWETWSLSLPNFVGWQIQKASFENGMSQGSPSENCDLKRRQPGQALNESEPTRAP